MQTGVGYGLICELPQPTPMLLAAHIHHSRAADLGHGSRQSHGKTLLIGPLIRPRCYCGSSRSVVSNTSWRTIDAA
jgi:hypothetical protein